MITHWVVVDTVPNHLTFERIAAHGLNLCHGILGIEGQDDGQTVRAE